MIRSRIPDKFRPLIFWGNLVSATLIGIAGLSLDLNEKALEGRGAGFKRAVDVTQAHAPEIAWLGAIGVFVCTLLGKSASDARIWRIVHKHLDDFQSKSCDEEVADHIHKVTLFEHRKWKLCWRGLHPKTPLWSGWLVPVERSGSRNLSTKLFFHAPIEGAHRAEGVAGLAWTSNDQNLRLGPLPLPVGFNDVEGIRKYAKDTKVREETVRKYLREKRPLPVCFFAHVLEVDGKPWGVLVVDSQSDALCPREKLLKCFKVLAPALDRLLSEDKVER